MTEAAIKTGPEHYNRLIDTLPNPLLSPTNPPGTCGFIMASSCELQLVETSKNTCNFSREPFDGCNTILLLQRRMIPAGLVMRASRDGLRNHSLTNNVCDDENRDGDCVKEKHKKANKRASKCKRDPIHLSVPSSFLACLFKPQPSLRCFFNATILHEKKIRRYPAMRTA